MTADADIVREGKPLCWSPERQAYFSIDVVLTRAEAAEAERDRLRAVLLLIETDTDDLGYETPAAEVARVALEVARVALGEGAS